MRYVMKVICMLVVSCMFVQLSFGQKIASRIDTLNSIHAIEKLIHAFDKDYKRFLLMPITDPKINRYGQDEFCRSTADSLGITQSFYKADFDQNGYTDLLAIGRYYEFTIFIIMNYGDDSLKLNRLTRRAFQRCTFPKIINDTIIRYYYVPEPRWHPGDTIPALQFSDLIYKYGDFIEYNAQPKDYGIEKIEFQTTLCYGLCPKFSVSINKDQSATFNAQMYNLETMNSKEIKGTFSTIIKDSDFSQLVNLLNYIDFPNLKDNYEVSWTDSQTCTLTVTYSNGKVKQIKDYGLIGTYGLDRLYELFFKLRFNQEWK